MIETQVSKKTCSVIYDTTANVFENARLCGMIALYELCDVIDALHFAEEGS